MSRIKLSNVILFFALALSFPSVHCEESIEVHTMEEMLSSIRLEKKQLDRMVDKMVKNGRMSEEEGARVHRDIASVKDSDIEVVKKAAIHEFVKSNN